MEIENVAERIISEVIEFHTQKDFSPEERYKIKEDIIALLTNIEEESED